MKERLPDAAMSTEDSRGPSSGGAPGQREEASEATNDPRQTLHVWIDFVCPYCFLAAGPLAEALDGLGLDIEWMPFELRPRPQPTLRPEDEYLQTVWPRSVYPLAARLGVYIRLPEVSPQPYSRLAFEGLQFAKDRGRTTEYVRAVLRGFFQRSLDIGDAGVLEMLAREAGLPGTAFRAALEERRYAAAHDAALALAHRTRIRAVPTLIFGAHRFEGIPDPAALRRIIEAYLAPGGRRPDAPSPS